MNYIAGNYVPSTRAVRDCYRYAYERRDGSIEKPTDIANAEFDRWLAGVTKTIKQEAFVEARDAILFVGVASVFNNTEDWWRGVVEAERIVGGFIEDGDTTID